MNLIFELSRKHLKENKKRTALTIAAIVISVSMVTAISGMILSFQNMLYEDAVLKDGLWHIEYKVYEEEAAHLIAQEEYFSSVDVNETEDTYTLSIMVSPLDKTIFDRSEEICFKYGIGQEDVRYHNNLLIAKGIAPGNYNRALYTMGSILIVIIALTSVLVISNAFTISTSQRRKQFGLLKSTGATKGQIRVMVLYEGIYLGIISIPLGIAVGYVVQSLALYIANRIFGTIKAVHFLSVFKPVLSFPVILIAVICTLITILISALLPAVKVSKISPIEAIRQNNEITIKKSRLKRRLPFQKMMSFEWILAMKTMKRNKSKYRTTVISLAVSVILFISVSSFGSTLMEATDMVYANYDSNIAIAANMIPDDVLSEIREELPRLTGDKVNYFAFSLYQAPIEELLSDSYMAYFEQHYDHLFALYIVSDEEFDSICRKNNINSGDFLKGEIPSGILINHTGTMIFQGTRTSFTPFNYKKDTIIQLDRYSDDGFPFMLKGEIKNVPSVLSTNFYGERMNVIISESIQAQYENIMEPGNKFLTLLSETPDDTEILVSDYLRERLAGICEEDQYSVINFEAYAQNSRNLWLLISIFVYGFIALLSLIAIANVITTISTNISLRKRELSMLSSIGMTGKGMRKMLFAESLIYGIKALLWGIPLSILTSFLIHNSMQIAFDFDYLFPFEPIIISIAFILLLTNLTALYARRKILSENIAQSLREDMN